MDFIDIKSNAPKYKQIINSVMRNVNDGELKRDDKLPSINAICKEYKLSRDTVVKAYDALKEKGIIESRHGKGFFIACTDADRSLNVFLLFDVIANAYKETLVDGLNKYFNGKATLDFYCHNHNSSAFESLINDNLGKYEYYVIIPFEDPRVYEQLSRIDQSKLLLLDIDVEFPQKNCSVVHQSHSHELEKALTQLLPRIRHYKEFILVLNPSKHYPIRLADTFRHFCALNEIPMRIVDQTSCSSIMNGQAYFVIENSDLVNIVKVAQNRNIIVGSDVGILSYNKTPLKEIVLGGVTTISTDFEQMAKATATTILSGTTTKTLIPTTVIDGLTL